MADLLSKNNYIGSLFFSLSRWRVRLSYPVPNVGLTEATLKADLKELVDTAVDTMKLWDPSTLAEK